MSASAVFSERTTAILSGTAVMKFCAAASAIGVLSGKACMSLLLAPKRREKPAASNIPIMLLPSFYALDYKYLCL
jgi:hypothetical protein